MSNKAKRIILIVNGFLIIGLLGCSIVMSQDSRISESDTSEYTATVTKTETVGTGENIHVKIYTEEYKNYWVIISNIATRIDLEPINSLSPGQSITLRIRREAVAALNNGSTEFIDIVSLKTDSTEIITLEDYRNISSAAMVPAKISICIFNSLLIIATVILIIRMKKKQN